MCRLLESIQVKEGRLVNAGWHSRRFNASRKELFGIEMAENLENLVQVPEECRLGLYRCRVIYGEMIHSVEFIPYHYRKIESLKLVEADTIDYHLKFAQRDQLEKLFAQRGDCDDIIIVQNGCLTDSFAANLVFRKGQAWYTPDTPLLPGTQRAKLLGSGEISIRRITLENYRDYHCAGLINAFSDLDNMPVIAIDKIFR
ncbi:MAG: aminotransferase class IV [Bacteroidota bacterium]